MTDAGAPRRWGFRARLAALIAGVFIVGGAVLLLVQYLLVGQLFSMGVHSLSTTCTESTIDEIAVVSCEDGNASAIVGASGTLSAEDGIVSLIVQQGSLLSQEVLSGLLLWSVVVLAVFAVLAVLAAWWLSKRSLGRIAQITGTTREITRDDLHRRLALPGPDDEVKELGDTIDDMLDRLEDAFTRQERFIAGASHELRTPLTTTRTLLEIPLAQGRVPVELQPALRGALAANERSERLIAALLTLARTRHASAEAGAGEADLAAIAAAALAERAADAAARGLGVTAPLSTAAVAAADAGLVGIAVANLVDNGIRHNRDGGVLEVRTGVDDRGAWLEVAGDGADLTGTDLRPLTEPFHRGDDTRLAGDGLGLGLALVDTIAASQGGRLELTARPGGGLCARLSFPARRP